MAPKKQPKKSTGIHFMGTQNVDTNSSSRDALNKYEKWIKKTPGTHTMTKHTAYIII